MTVIPNNVIDLYSLTLSSGIKLLLIEKFQAILYLVKYIIMPFGSNAFRRDVLSDRIFMNGEALPNV